MMIKTRSTLFAMTSAALIAMATLVAQDKPARDIDVDDVSVADGYRIEAVAANLTVPTTAVFDGTDLLVAESGYSNAGQARVVRIRRDGTSEIVVSSALNPPVTGLAVREGRVYVSHAGIVSVVQGNGLKDIVTDASWRSSQQQDRLWS